MGHSLPLGELALLALRSFLLVVVLGGINLSAIACMNVYARHTHRSLILQELWWLP
jgi:hypothetical protein